jgi:hypothetical protein
LIKPKRRKVKQTAPELALHSGEQGLWISEEGNLQHDEKFVVRMGHMHPCLPHHRFPFRQQQQVTMPRKKNRPPED